MELPLIPVSNSESGNIVAAGYDPLRQTMRLEFNGGTKYDYHGITPEIWQAFGEAPSAGRFLSDVVKPSAPASRVKE